MATLIDFLLVQLTSGVHPYQGLAFGLAMYKILNNMKPSPQTHPGLEENDVLWEIMERQWAFEPEQRPSISEVQDFVSRLSLIIILDAWY